MKFRPCIDLHGGLVKQIVGSTLKDDAGSSGSSEPVENFVATKPAGAFAQLYSKHQMPGGHVIMLGKGNEEAALQALRTYPGGMQVGGGVTPSNAKKYIDAGASHVIVTSYVFRDGAIDYARLNEMVATVGKDQLVLDLSCRRKQGGGNDYYVVTDRWQKYTNFMLSKQSLAELATYCDEFLVHGVDVEGMRVGILEELVTLLGEWSPIPVTYAGGAKSIADLHLVKKLGKGKVDLTIGSALDIFGGEIGWDAVVAWQNSENQEQNSSMEGRLVRHLEEQVVLLKAQRTALTRRCAEAGL